MSPRALYAGAGREKGAGGAAGSPSSAGRGGGWGALSAGWETPCGGAGVEFLGSVIAATGAGGAGSRLNSVESSFADETDIELWKGPGPSEGASCGFEAIFGATSDVASVNAST